MITHERQKLHTIRANEYRGPVGRQPLATLVPGEWLRCGDVNSAGYNYM